MHWPLFAAFWAMAACFVGADAWAGSLALTLKLQAGKETQSATEEPIAVGVKPRARKIVEGKAGMLVQIHWTLTNSSAKTEMKNVLVHFFAVKEDAVGQRNVPKLTKNVTAESAVTVDFSPGEQARGVLTFTVNQPGAYLIRLQTMGAPEDEDCFAALDLVIK